ncbi:MAG: dephospho-CoA kinase [Bacteroidota bacterium]|nr:dephospho-CoA kinase [Bacteroidota bacterium]MEC7945027.1 dephospho-CoA kinase [Bacteroidota bacterium]MEC7955268.1 dephospho-CoA kinase [Bacteroidota bacterium]MED6302972.1 dephospho-CoA kinase [Bacteroidota bacterium]|tara:strand:+ start:5994 stop:6578 length:585 start_codon:yes stop_codon:yes gene_type:complete
MLKVGITGGIGSGKSTVSRFFSELGVPVYDSDQRAKSLMQHDDSIIIKIKKEFGDDSYLNNVLNRSHIAEIVFKNELKLKQLNAIVHPVVRTDFNNWLSQNSNARFVIKEAAIMIESGAYKDLDKLIVVNANREQKIKWIKKRDHLLLEDIENRIQNQLSDKIRNQYADFIIENNSSKKELKQQVLSIYNKLIV